MDKIRKIPLAVWTGLTPFVLFMGFSLLYQAKVVDLSNHLARFGTVTTGMSQVFAGVDKE